MTVSSERSSGKREGTEKLKAGSPWLTAAFRGLYAETENTQRRCQALQTNRDGESEAGTCKTASHPDVQRQEDETQIREIRPGERRRPAQSKAHDPVSVTVV